MVNFENCIKCETCWRTSDLADWGRDGAHRFIYPVVSPVVTQLLAAVDSVEDIHPIKPRTLDRWQAVLGDFTGRFRENTGLQNGQHWAELGELNASLLV